VTLWRNIGPRNGAELTKRTAIVTGSSSSIGATAILLAQRGWNVAVNYSQNAASAARGVRAHGAEALACRADVGEDADCRRMAADTLARWGRIDALVNSAGTGKFVSTPISGAQRRRFPRIYRINVVGPTRWRARSPRR
jgi:3-oxoacyl-[acyl-carrier protein] reductase